MTRESDRLDCALWLQSGINAEVLYTHAGRLRKKFYIYKETHEVQTRTCEKMPTHDDDLSSGARA